MQTPHHPYTHTNTHDLHGFGCCPEKTTTHHHTPPTQRIPLDRGLQWGSDPNFCYHGFSCPIGSWTEERLVRNAMRNMAYMASSVKPDFTFDFNVSDYNFNHLRNTESSDVVRLNGFDISPRSPTPPSTASPSSTSTSTSMSSPEKEADSQVQLQPPSKKRKCVQKSGQKLCHCRSEKKRREAVSQGYRDLSLVVPGLEGQNFTRKYVLNSAAQYLEMLLEGNEALRRQLKQIDDRKDGVCSKK